jgi:hypothetical protein
MSTQPIRLPLTVAHNNQLVHEKEKRENKKREQIEQIELNRLITRK